MANTFHNPDGIAPPQGAYSHAVETPASARMLTIAGQIGIAEDGSVPESVEAQTELVWENLDAILKAAGMAMTDLIKIQTFLVNRADLAAYAGVRSRFLGDHRPASTLIAGVELIDPRFLVEVEAVAAKG